MRYLSLSIWSVIVVVGIIGTLINLIFPAINHTPIDPFWAILGGIALILVYVKILFDELDKAVNAT